MQWDFEVGHSDGFLHEKIGIVGWMAKIKGAQLYGWDGSGEATHFLSSVENDGKGLLSFE